MNTKGKKFKKTFDKKVVIGSVISAFSLAIVVAAVFVCFFFISSLVKKDTTYTLRDVADQGAMSIEREVDQNYSLLQTVHSHMLELPNDMSIDDKLAEFLPFIEAQGLVRIGFCDTDGLSYSSDNGSVHTDLAYREFFQRGMRGQNTVTEILYDALRDEHEPINILAMPAVNGEGDIYGVIGLTYYAEKFNSAYVVKSFDGKGFSFAANEKQEIIVSSNTDIVPLAKDLFGDVFKNGGKNVSALRRAVSNSKTLSTAIKIAGVEYNIHSRPLSLLDGDVNWTVFTVVPISVMKERISQINTGLVIMLSIIIVVVAWCIVGMVFLSRKSRMKTHRLAYVDNLTGGDNFNMFVHKLSRMKPVNGSFIAVDILDFRYINITVGVQAANGVLRNVQRVLEDSVYENECVAHIGQDDYVIFLATEDKDEIVERLRVMSDKVDELIEADELPTVKLQFGVFRALSNFDAEDAYTRASQAIESIDQSRVPAYSFFRGENNTKYIYEHELIDSFDQALQGKEFKVWLQPKFSAKTQKIVGAEALVRWYRNGTVVSPGVFIPLFEENGLITRLDKYMLTEVCKLQREWQDAGKKIVPVSVNLSRASLCLKDISGKINSVIDRYGIDRSFIQLEVTESSVEGEHKIIELLDGLRSVGVRILMDDFGTGYSSLALLSSGRFDTIKIDKSLVDNMTNENGKKLVHHIIDMAHSLELHITVEGVEREEQYEYFKDHDCDDIQGYYFSPPLKAEDYVGRLEN